MDNCVLAKDGSETAATAPVAKDRESRGFLARPVLREGRMFQDAVDKVAESTRRLGHRGRALLETYSEPALINLWQGRL
eukprot:1884450-Alexandrium_andersonii.AAC.1